MKINIAKSAGFCFGVKRAINIAGQLAAKEKNIFMLGDIVHNEDVVRQLKRLGIKKIRKLSKRRNAILLIRAHGVPKSIQEKAVALGYRIMDATCPMVKHIHRKAIEHELKGYHIILIGSRNHDEVRGICGQLKGNALVIEGMEKLPFSEIPRVSKIAVLVQSTQNEANVTGILKRLRRHNRNLKFIDTICMPTKIKQQEIKRMPYENDVMIIIGSKTSANTKRLFEISRSINRKTHWIQEKNQIKRTWFRNVKKTGISAGASTPDVKIKEIYSHIRKLTRPG